MNKFLGIGLAVGGALIVAKYLGYDIGIGDDTPIEPSGSVNTSNPNAQAASTTKQMIIGALVQAGLSANTYRTVHQFNYYYKLVRGVDAPAPEELGLDGDRLYSIDEYWSAMTGKGISGLERWKGGLGTIANHVNPYLNNPYGRGYGNNIGPNGAETFIVRFGG